MRDLLTRFVTALLSVQPDSVSRAEYGVRRPDRASSPNWHPHHPETRSLDARGALKKLREATSS